MKSVYLFIFLITLSHISSASWTEDFAALKSIPRSYEDTGAICEELARLKIQKEYPRPQFEVLTGIAYETEDRVIGELDLVVFNTQLQRVIKIGEVKCWKDVPSALLKAQEQRARFLKTIRSNKPIQFRFTSTGEVLDPNTFENNTIEFFSVGQKGALDFGFDREVEYTFKELRDYRYEMLRCQSQGQCVKFSKGF